MLGQPGRPCARPGRVLIRSVAPGTVREIERGAGSEGTGLAMIVAETLPPRPGGGLARSSGPGSEVEEPAAEPP